MNEVKISVDAAVFKEPEGVGFGIVIRDSDGLLVTAKTLFNSQLVAPLMAEALGIKEALSWCDQVQGERIIVETDCLAAAQAIRSSCPMSSHFGLVVEECRRKSVLSVIQHRNSIAMKRSNSYSHLQVQVDVPRVDAFAIDVQALPV
ncbi:hypothetical protein AgCh_026260 [Apium graveolens]